MEPFSSEVFTAEQEHRVACTAPRGVPKPHIWWERNGMRIPTSGRVHQEAGDLVFTSIAEKDAGIYTCYAANKAGEKKQNLNITVASKQLPVCVEGTVQVWCALCMLWGGEERQGEVSLEGEAGLASAGLCSEACS